jgi:hypothetical protein
MSSSTSEVQTINCANKEQGCLACLERGVIVKSQVLLRSSSCVAVPLNSARQLCLFSSCRFSISCQLPLLCLSVCFVPLPTPASNLLSAPGRAGAEQARGLRVLQSGVVLLPRLFCFCLICDYRTGAQLQVMSTLQLLLSTPQADQGGQQALTAGIVRPPVEHRPCLYVWNTAFGSKQQVQYMQ